jgi:hypothetical protein
VSNSDGTFTVGNDTTIYRSEQRAYQITDTILRSGNAGHGYNCGMAAGDCHLGTAITSNNVGVEIDKIIAHNYSTVVDKKTVPVTPTNQGGSIIPH